MSINGLYKINSYGDSLLEPLKSEFTSSLTLDSEKGEESALDQVERSFIDRVSSFPFQISTLEQYTGLKKQLLEVSQELPRYIQFDDGFHKIVIHLDLKRVSYLISQSSVFSQLFGSEVFGGRPLLGIQKLFSEAQYNQECEAFLSEAEGYFNHTYTPLSGPSINYSGNSPEKLLTAIYAKSDGLCLGEVHNQPTSKFFLCKYMDLLVRLGVTTLFIEGYQTSIQKDIDVYLQGDSYNFPWGLERNISNIVNIWQKYMPAGSYTGRDVFIAAKKSGMRRIIAIDSDLTRPPNLLGESMEDVRRLAAMNYFAKLMIDHKKGQEKCLIWVGQFHTVRNIQVPSLSDIFGYPCIHVQEIDGNQVCCALFARPSVRIAAKKTDLFGKRETYTDFTISMASPLKNLSQYS
ncbi:MAG TPA: hypothetical protein VLG76_07910 [Rhabdochlamydiaceae bacterium]|nr:hypothetical protein [Rhabdochlamydiaceae bacterium]